MGFGAGSSDVSFLSLLARESIPVDGLYSKSWEELRDVPDVVITVCDDASGEACPLYLEKALRSHWGVFDPAKVVGDERFVEAEFERAYRILRFRIEALLAFFHSGQMGSQFF